MRECKKIDQVFSTFFNKNIDLCFMDDDEGFTLTEPAYYFIQTTENCKNWIQSDLYFTVYHLCLQKIKKSVKIIAYGEVVELKP